MCWACGAVSEDDQGESGRIQVTGGGFTQLLFDLEPETHGNGVNSEWCFLDRPRAPFICPRFIIAWGQMALHPASLSSSFRSAEPAGELPATGQMVRGPRWRKLCLSAAIVVVWPAAALGRQQRAVVKFHQRLQSRQKLRLHSGCVCEQISNKIPTFSHQ